MRTIFAFFIILLAAGCISDGNAGDMKTTKIAFEPSEVVLDVQIAQTDYERAVGLMGRQSIGQNKGMLFVYEKEQNLSFWMANTKIPLCIIFLDEGKKIVDIQKMEPCGEAIYTRCKSYYPAKFAKYAIEAGGNFSDDNEIEIGDSAKWEIG